MDRRRILRSAIWVVAATALRRRLPAAALQSGARNLTFGVDRSRAFAGGDVGAWRAYNISSDPVSGIGLWNDAELLSYLATGKAR
jgi:hypothetical protein